MKFMFHPIAPNSMYLVTLEHAFSSFRLGVRTGDGSEQSSTVENPDRPFFVVFKTMPDQQFASIELFAAAPGGAELAYRRALAIRESLSVPDDPRLVRLRTEMQSVLTYGSAAAR